MATAFTCPKCGMACLSALGLASHLRAAHGAQVPAGG